MFLIESRDKDIKKSSFVIELKTKNKSENKTEMGIKRVVVLRRIKLWER